MFFHTISHYVAVARERLRGLGVLTDVTARRKAERERDRLFDIAQDLIIIAGFDGAFRDLNPAVETALGYRRDEVVGSPYIDFVHPEDRPKVVAEIERLMAGEALVHFEIRYRHRDGSWRWTSWRVIAVHDEGLLYGVGRDVTERRQTEAALRQAQKMEAVGHLTGGVAHDFNNLLTVIIGNLELLRPKVADQPHVGRLLETMQHAAERGERLTGQLLAFSRRQRLQPETLDLNALIRAFEPLVRRAVGEMVQVETRLTPAPWPCTIDAAQLEAALLNLAVNASDAMPGGGRLTIETRNVERDDRLMARVVGARSGPYVIVAVCDTGTGIAPELVERVFEPFFTTKEVGKGSGLGLSQVYGFVEQSGGHVTIDSEVGQGTAIRLYLPPAETAMAAPARDARRPRGAEPAGGSERILLVEDDADVLQTAIALMVNLGYQVRAAAGPLEALAILRCADEPIDLLFSDVVMPQMSGIRLAEEARGLRPGLKVLLSSGYSKESRASQSGLHEGLPIIAKPYKEADLAAELRAILDVR